MVLRFRYLLRFLWLFSGAITMLTFGVKAQSNCELTTGTQYRIPVYRHVDQMPTFKQGDLFDYVSRQLQILEISDTEQIQSRIVARFVIDTTGQLDYISIVSSSGLTSTIKTKNLTRFEKSYLQMLKKMPRWQPGRCNGKLVAVEYTLPMILDFER